MPLPIESGAIYPSGILDNSMFPPIYGIGESVSPDEIESIIINRLSAEVKAIENELGTYPSEAISLSHMQGTDQGLDASGVNAVTVVEVRQAVDDTHSHGNKETLDKLDEETYNSNINDLSTGIITGGILSISGSGTTFDISVGSGQIVDSSDSKNPTITFVSWGSKSGLIDNYMSTDPETYIAIDTSGIVIQETEWFDDDDKRDYIILGTVGHPSLSGIEYVIPEAIVSVGVNLQFDSFLEAFGAFNIDGNIYGANGANLKIDKSAGNTFDGGSNFANSLTSPNTFTTDAASGISLNYNHTVSGGDWIAKELGEIDPNQYDTLNGLVTVPSGKWTIQTFYQYAPLNYNEMQYGQEYYDSKEAAVSAINEGMTVAPLLEFNVFRGWLIVKEGATDLSNELQAEFVSAGKLGSIGGGGGGGGGEINTASNVGTGGVGVYLQKSGVDLQFKNIAAGSNKITVTNDPTDKEVNVDVSEANLTHNNIGGLNSGNYIHLTSTEKTNVDDAITKKHAASGQFNIVNSGEIYGLTEKTVPVSGDFILMEDSEDIYRKKKVKMGNLIFPPYYYSESLGVSNSTSTYPNYVNKLTMSVTPTSGIYLFSWDAEVVNSNANKDSWIKVSNGTTIYCEEQISSTLVYSESGYRSVDGFICLNLPATSGNFYIDFCRTANTAHIKNAKLLLRRMG